MRLCTRKYEKLEKFESECDSTKEDFPVTREQIDEIIQTIENEKNYEPLPEKVKLLPDYLLLVLAFSKTYEVDLAIDSAPQGITVKLCFNDCAMPEGMTRTLGRIITSSDGMCIWTKVRDQDYDCVISLDFNTHKLKNSIQ